jgi:hypothetical protein
MSDFSFKSTKLNKLKSKKGEGNDMQETAPKKLPQGGGCTHLKKIRSLHVRPQKFTKKLTLVVTDTPRITAANTANHKGTGVGQAAHAFVERRLR